MKKNRILILVILAILVTAVSIFLINWNTPVLPDSVAINIYRDSTSSGGSRYTNYILVFDNRELISASHTYEGSSRDGEKYCDWIFDIESSTWAEQDNSVNCTEPVPTDLPLDFMSLNNKIKTGELKSEDKCIHFDTCYKLLETLPY